MMQDIILQLLNLLIFGIQKKIRFMYMIMHGMKIKLKNSRHFLQKMELIM